MKKILGLMFMLSLIAIQIQANDNLSDNITIPYTFNSGSTISSNQMNENFDEIENKYNHLLNLINKSNLISNDLIVFYVANEKLNSEEIRNTGGDVCSNSKPNLIYTTCNTAVPMVLDENQSLNSSNIISRYLSACSNRLSNNSRKRLESPC